MGDIHFAELFGFSLPVGEIILRGSAVYWFLFILFRVMGRRDIGSVGLADILVIVLIADAAVLPHHKGAATRGRQRGRRGRPIGVPNADPGRVLDRPVGGYSRGEHGEGRKPGADVTPGHEERRAHGKDRR